VTASNAAQVISSSRAPASGCINGRPAPVAAVRRYGNMIAGRNVVLPPFRLSHRSGVRCPRICGCCMRSDADCKDPAEPNRPQRGGSCRGAGPDLVTGRLPHDCGGVRLFRGHTPLCACCGEVRGCVGGGLPPLAPRARDLQCNQDVGAQLAERLPRTACYRKRRRFPIWHSAGPADAKSAPNITGRIASLRPQE
jgi:hypothetical protein